MLLLEGFGPSRGKTTTLTFPAGGDIRDCLAAARNCWYVVAFVDRKSRYATYYRRLAADQRCRYALSAIVFPSIATVEDTAAAGRRRKLFAAHPTRN